MHYYLDGQLVNIIPAATPNDVNDNWNIAMDYEEVEEPTRRRSRDANLTAECLVCGGRAATHQHYGAVCCYSCR